MTSTEDTNLPDPASNSNFWDARTQHLHLDWTVDFKAKLIHGSAEHTVVIEKDGTSTFTLDTSYIDITAVEVEGKQTNAYKLHDRVPVLGSQLDIPLAQGLKKSNTVKVKIFYTTTEQCTALGWLEKEQTDAGTHPFVYSQCQAIHARSLFPCQDTPAVKLTYTADVQSTLDGCSILLSARRISPPSTEGAGKAGTVYHYDQPVPMPSYLVAVAGGNLVYQSLGPRSGVWAEPTVIKAAAWEFDETERFIDTAENLVGKYEWSFYDVLVLPKSFPYGGMENTNLTFLTPTLLAGDRSLVDVVAHEGSHSWFGNLIGCHDWSSFWLNEGFTTYLERLILRDLYGEAARSFSFIIGYRALVASLKEFKNTPKFQRLHIDYAKGEDPDDAFSTVPYDKGSNFLLYLERTVGGLDIFLPYLRDYVQTFRNKAITTNMFREHLYAYFHRQGGSEMTHKLDQVDWNAWLYGEGTTLPVKMEYDTSLADKAYALADRWDKARSADKVDFSSTDLKDFNSNQIVVFLERLEGLDAFQAKTLDQMNAAYAFDSTASAEIRLRWYTVSLQPESGGKYAKSASEWVADKGRMKFCRPVYRLIFGLDRELAQKTFTKNQAFYHPIARNMIYKDLQMEKA